MDDIARGTIAGLRPLGYATINLGSAQPVALIDAIRLIEGLTQKSARLDFQPAARGDVTATWANIEQAKTCLGWAPRVSIEQGMRHLVEWYQAEREWARRVATG